MIGLESHSTPCNICILILWCFNLHYIFRKIWSFFFFNVENSCKRFLFWPAAWKMFSASFPRPLQIPFTMETFLTSIGRIQAHQSNTLEALISFLNYFQQLCILVCDIFKLTWLVWIITLHHDQGFFYFTFTKLMEFGIYALV